MCDDLIAASVAGLFGALPSDCRPWESACAMLGQRTLFSMLLALAQTLPAAVDLDHDVSGSIPMHLHVDLDLQIGYSG